MHGSIGRYGPNDAVQLIGEGGPSIGPHRRQPSHVETFDVVVIGAGQAGLSVGYHLKQAGVNFTIVDSNARVGDAWRKRWDSLRLFTCARLDSLEGWPFPAVGGYFPTKDEMADYLESYASHFDLPVRTGARVEKLSRHQGRYIVKAGSAQLEAKQVVVAMAGSQRANVPAFAAQLSRDIVQLHAIDYRNPGQLNAGGVLLVGAGNSGAEIAMESARNGHQTRIAGRSTGVIPFHLDSFAGRHFMQPLLHRLLFHRLLTIGTPIGRRARQWWLSKGMPLMRVKPAHLAAAGVECVPRVIGVRHGRPLLEGGYAPTVSNVIWCNGFDAGFDWIDLPLAGADGTLRHNGGVVPDHPGLYFVGLNFLYALSSSMIHGVGRDARRIVNAIKAGLPAHQAKRVQR